MLVTRALNHYPHYPHYPQDRAARLHLREVVPDRLVMEAQLPGYGSQAHAALVHPPDNLPPVERDPAFDHPP